MKKIPLSCLALGLIWCSSAFATKISATRVSTTQTVPGTEISIQLEFELEGSETAPWCGLQVDFGNGAGRSVRVGDNGAADAKMEVKYAYPGPGKFNIQVSGRSLVRGLKTAVACNGGPFTIPVTVVDPVAIQMQQQLEQSRRQLEENERALKSAEEARQRQQAAAEEQRRAAEAQLRDANEKQRQAEEQNRRLELENRIKQLEAENRRNAAAAAESRRAAQQPPATAPAAPAAPAPQTNSPSSNTPPVTRPKAESIL